MRQNAVNTVKGLRERGVAVEPSRISATWTKWGAEMRRRYGHITHQKMRNTDGEWIHKDTYQDGQSRQPAEHAYTEKRFDGFVDLLKRGPGDCPVAIKTIDVFYRKFKNEYGLVNLHLPICMVR